MNGKIENLSDLEEGEVILEKKENKKNKPKVLNILCFINLK